MVFGFPGGNCVSENIGVVEIFYCFEVLRQYFIHNTAVVKKGG